MQRKLVIFCGIVSFAISFRVFGAAKKSCAMVGNPVCIEYQITPPLFTLAQPPVATPDCQATNAQPTCSLTATITAGHTLVFISAVTTVSTTAPMINSATGDSFSLCSSRPTALESGQYVAVGCAYILHATGGVAGTYTFTWATTITPTVFVEDIWLYDLKWTGSSVSFDTNNSSSTNTGCTTCPAPALPSFTGPDAVLQIASNIFTPFTAISGGYTGSFGGMVSSAAAYLLNVSSYTAPNWTTSTKGAGAFLAVGFTGH